MNRKLLFFRVPRLSALRARAAMLLIAMLCVAGGAWAQQALPYEYGFENNDLAADGWTTQNPSGLNASEFGISSNARTGSYGFRFSSYYDKGENTQYLISPELNAPKGVTVQFYYRSSSSSSSGETFQVGYSTTDTDISSFTFGSAINATNTSWEQTEEFVFPAGTKYVAVYYFPNYQYRLFVDDFTFSFEEYAKPTDLTVSDLTTTSATISWTAPTGSPTGYTYQYKMATDENWSAETTITATSITLSGLEAATTYNFQVKAVYGTDGESDFVTKNFTTLPCIGGRVIEYNLTDSYSDGWNGNAINILDGCGNVVETLTIESGASNNGVLYLCGDAYEFVWKKGSYPAECSFTLTENDTEIIKISGAGSLNDGDVLYTIGTIIPIPTGLTAGTPGKNSVVLNWTAGGSETAWEICINDDESNLITASTNENYELSGLEPGTEYTVKVRACIDAITYSCWSNKISFTTEATFLAPTNVAANNVTATTADISWIGNTEANSYNLRYAINSDFFDDFENGIDAKGWTVVRNGGGNANTDWCVVNSNTIFSNEAIPAHSGDYVAMSRSYAGEAYNVDNWMISPQVELGGTLIYWVMDDGQYHEHYDIYVCTTSFDADAFDESAFTKICEPGDASREWTEHTVDLSAYAGQTGYIAFRNTDNDQDFLFIDDVTITVPSASVEWTTVNDVTNPYTIEGLTRETKYKVEVQAVYEGGSSAWTSTTFTTIAPDAVPVNLQTADITATTATLNWEGLQDSYNVRYRKISVFDFNSFNSDEERAGWDFNNAIYGIDDPVYNISGTSNFFLSMGWSSTDEEFIVSPELPAYPSGSTLEFYPFYYSAANTFQIGYSTTIRDDVDAYTWSDPIAPVSLGEAYSTKFSEVLPDGVKYIAFRATASDQTHCIFIDDIKIYYCAPEWDETISNVNANTLAISDLTNGSEYEWQVQGNWTEGTTEWSKSASFTTIAILNLNDAEDNSTLLAAANGKIAEVTLVGRTLTSGMWNTFAVPFNISEDDLDNLGITAKRLASSTLTDGTLTLNFADATEIEAGKPYLVKVDENLNLGAITFDGVTVSKDIVPFTSSNVDFIPTFGKTTIGEEDDDAKNVLFLAAENTLKNPTSLPADIKGFRAYFQLKGDAVGARAFSLDLGDGETTGIADVRSKMADVRGDYFDLQGRKVENTAKKGIYIQNGRKVVIK